MKEIIQKLFKKKKNYQKLLKQDSKKKLNK